MASSRTKTNDFDVLIVGAGPTGLALGLQLARYGVNFQIIDKKSTFSDHSMAFAIQGSTLESLNDLGISDGMMQLGMQVKKVDTYIRGQHSFDIDFKPQSGRSFPFLLTIEQSKTERLLAGALQQKGHAVSWNAELLSFKQTETGVTVEIQQNGKKGVVTATYIVGCDGQSSTVREILGIPLQGNSYEEKYIVGDMNIDWKLAKNEGHAFLHPSDIFMVFPLPGGHHRVITTQAGLDHQGDVSILDLVSKFKNLCPFPGTITAPTWVSSYNIKRAVAPQMRIKNVFLAGDAAHIHSPIGGQGINTGIEDAYNLGWKLGLAINGAVEDAFLNSYEAERLPVAKAYLAHTNLAMNIVTSRSKLGQILRDMVAPLVLNYPAAQKQLQRILGDAPVSYTSSPLNYSAKEENQGIAQRIKDTVSGGVQIGNRVANFNLLVPQEFKRTQLLNLFRTPKHVILVMLGEKPKEFQEQYQNFSKIKEYFKDFAEAYFIVGEHAIDYTSFDVNLPDVFIDPDGLGHELYKCYDTTLYMIRPDNYICFRGAPNIEALKNYVQEHYNLSKLPIKSTDGSIEIAV